MNYTITAPNGATDHGDARLLCLPTKWTDYIAFVLGNYVAHAFTVVASPGASTADSVFVAFMALLFPMTGMAQAVTVMQKHSKFTTSPLARAAESRALCMVVRSSRWRPRNGDFIGNAIRCRNEEVNLRQPMKCTVCDTRSPRNEISYDSSVHYICNPSWAYTETKSFAGIIDGAVQFVDLVDTTTHVHGFHGYSEEYALAYIPENATVITNANASERRNSLAEVYSFGRAIVALLQLAFSIFTLYGSSWVQIPQYGYAAYGLTVVPFAIMSASNCVANMISPTYPALYLIRSDVMEEAEGRGSIFDGVVGRLAHEDFAGAVTETPHQTARGQGSHSAFHYCDYQNEETKSDQQNMRNSTHSDIENPGPIMLSIPCCSDFSKQWISKDNSILQKYEFLKVLLDLNTSDTSRSSMFKRFIDRHRKKHLDTFLAFSPIMLLIISALQVSPFAVYAGLSHFQPGQSTLRQRVIIMSWLCVGMSTLVPDLALRPLLPNQANNRGIDLTSLYYILYLLYLSVPTILAWWQVGTMMSQFGVCQRLY